MDLERLTILLKLQSGIRPADSRVLALKHYIKSLGPNLNSATKGGWEHSSLVPYSTKGATEYDEAEGGEA